MIKNILSKKIPVFAGFFALYFFSSYNAQGQDMHFTQFYASKNYLNPAFVGIHGCTRVASTYRDQWPSIPGRFVSATFALDHNLQMYNSSVGLLLTNDVAGSSRLRSTGVNLQYAYELPINDEVRIRAGFQGGLNTRSIDYTSLLFGDQIVNGTTNSSYNMPAVAYADFAAGGVIYSELFWAGFSAHHITRPNESLLRETSEVPIKYSVHGGGRIPLNGTGGSRKSSTQLIYPAFNYKSQGKFDQLDLGFYYEHTGIVIGTWYRGIPLLKAYRPGYMNNDAIALIVGYAVDNFNIGYSYDFTISKLAFASGGAHEISCNYTFCAMKTQKKKRRRINVPCPSF
ncbi:MAG: type IX secretion system membrane protein PorP/SprF [Bacteroidetes bacterium]|nr:type IX secretion system membrane protein PorP/SprF [Bacteroidota bacterium]